jgi:TPR repeat protein
MTSATTARAADGASPKASQEDLKKEFEATKKKAESGDPRAQYSLAGFYAKGAGVETNNTEAVAWFVVATDKLPMAALARVEVEKKMSPGQIRTAWLRAKELRANVNATAKVPAK